MGIKLNEVQVKILNNYMKMLTEAKNKTYDKEVSDNASYFQEMKECIEDINHYVFEGEGSTKNSPTATEEIYRFKIIPSERFEEMKECIEDINHYVFEGEDSTENNTPAKEEIYRFKIIPSERFEEMKEYIEDINHTMFEDAEY